MLHVVLSGILKTGTDRQLGREKVHRTVPINVRPLYLLVIGQLLRISGSLLYSIKVHTFSEYTCWLLYCSRYQNVYTTWFCLPVQYPFLTIFHPTFQFYCDVHWNFQFLATLLPPPVLVKHFSSCSSLWIAQLMSLKMFSFNVLAVPSFNEPKNTKPKFIVNTPDSGFYLRRVCIVIKNIQQRHQQMSQNYLDWYSRQLR